MTDIQRQEQQVQEALRRAVTAALERKRKLGQYAVVYKNGKTVRIMSDELTEQGNS